MRANKGHRATRSTTKDRERIPPKIPNAVATTTAPTSIQAATANG
jgi:hypothetical protein